jgi:hypothetical protein
MFRQEVPCDEAVMNTRQHTINIIAHAQLIIPKPIGEQQLETRQFLLFIGAPAKWMCVFSGLHIERILMGKRRQKNA